jgi:hypothetical protein
MSLTRQRRTEYSPGFVQKKEGVIVEMIGKAEEYGYAVKVGKERPITFPTYSFGDITYYPPTNCPWPVATEPEEYGSPERLYTEVRDFVYEHIDISYDDRYYDVMACWLMGDWIQDWFTTATYLHFHGPPSSGKTRALEILHCVGYRPLLSPSISAPALYRTVEVFKPTFLVDEAELYTEGGLDEARREVLSILNAGYRRGQYAIRADQHGEAIKLFDVWGFKALASIQTLPDTLQGRCIRIPMMRATRQIRRRIDEEWAERIRNLLLSYRFDYLLEEPPLGENPIDVPDGRLIEIFTPLLLVAPTPPVEQRLVRLAKDIYQTQVEEEQTTTEAQVFISLLEVMKPGIPTVPVSDIADRYNEGKPKGEQITSQTIGYILKRLGFRKKREARTGRVAAILDANLIERLRVRYKILEQKELPTQAAGEKEDEGGRPSLGEDERRLPVIMVKGAGYLTEEVAELAKWPKEYAGRVLETARRDGLVFRTPDGRWMLT